MQTSVQPSTLLARVVVVALARAGVREVVLCPGSRSAPLAYALHDADAAGLLRLHVRHDERAAAFTALGMGRATGVPAAVVTTSGTAVANLHPAVLEAAEAGVPLVVLSADRPHAVRGTWANQTTALQAGLFGAAARHALDLPVPGPHEPLARARATWAAGVADLVAASLGQRDTRPGPVHGDLAFADPLVPDVPWTPPSLPAPSADGAGRTPSGGALSAASAEQELEGGPARTVVVAGDGPAALGAAARRLAERHGWPLLAEPSSGARGGPNAVAAYRLLLDQPWLGGSVERVVAVGRPTLSRPVSALLARADVELVHLVAHAGDPGPGPARPHQRLLLSADQRGEQDDDDARAGGDWLRRWQRAGAAAQAVTDAVLDDEARAGHLTGPLLAREVAAAVARPVAAPVTGTGSQNLLVAAASNAVRDLDLAAAPWADPAAAPLVLAARGLSGIDGTLSAATGAALAAGAPTTALVGDLAALHDANGLLLPPGEPEPDLRVVVLDDDGGGIFSGLEHGDPEHSDRARVFERLFGTPHGRDLVALTSALGVPARRVTDLADLRRALTAPVREREVLVVPADRTDLRALHARIRARVAGAVRGLGPGS